MMTMKSKAQSDASLVGYAVQESLPPGIGSADSIVQVGLDGGGLEQEDDDLSNPRLKAVVESVRGLEAKSGKLEAQLEKLESGLRSQAEEQLKRLQNRKVDGRHVSDDELRDDV